MKKVLIVYGIVMMTLIIGFVMASELILKDEKFDCDGNCGYKPSSTITFETLSNGYKINGITITCEEENLISVLSNKKSKSNHKIKINRRITGKGKLDCYFNIQPDKVEEISYFSHPDMWLNYVGGDKNLSKLSELCPEKTGRCGHGDYNKLIMTWKESNIKIILEEIDLDGNIYNTKRTENGFRIQGLNDFKNEVDISDVISSGGEIFLNGSVTCAEWFDFEHTQTDCTYVNKTQDSGNITTLNTMCKTNFNGSLGECAGYSVSYMLDEMSDLMGTSIIHNHSRINMSECALSWTSSSPTPPVFRTFIPYQNNIHNHSQYFKNCGFYGIELSQNTGYMNLTGDNVIFNWFAPSGISGLVQIHDPKIEGVGLGITTKGDQFGFPLMIAGIVSGDMTQSTNGLIFYIFGPGGGVSQNISIDITGGTWITDNGAVIFVGSLFNWNIVADANFTDMTLINTPVLTSAPFYATGVSRHYWTPNYVFNASETDEAVVSNITVTSIESGPAWQPEGFGLTPPYYNKIDSVWDERILAEYAVQGNGILDPSLPPAQRNPNGLHKSTFTSRMEITNSSYFPVNSSLDIFQTVTTNGKKDMIKIPYSIKLNPNSDFSLVV